MELTRHNARSMPAMRLVLPWPVLLLAFAASTAVAAAQQQVSVDRLDQLAAQLHSASDGKAAQSLAQLQLTERLSAVKLVRLQAVLPGDRSRTALLALADASAFLDLPASDIPALPAPDRDMQLSWFAKAGAYLAQAMPRLPDFTATQRILHFSDGPLKAGRPAPGKPWDTRLHLEAESRAEVRYLGGHEEVQAHAPPSGQSQAKPLTVVGVFGPILSVALNDILASGPSWGHWESRSHLESQSQVDFRSRTEQASTSPVAVFRYQVSAGNSHYDVSSSSNLLPPSPRRGYRGEITIDPSSGAILRITLQAVEEPNGPISDADIMVEYDEVQLAGRLWTCPIHSVAVGRAREIDLMHDLYKFSATGPMQYRLQLNDVSYSDYHLFGSGIRILPDADAPPPVQH